MTDEARLGYSVRKNIPAVVRIISAIEAAKPIVPKPTLEQMLRGKIGRGLVISVDGGQWEVGQNVPQINRRQAELLDRLGHLEAFDAGNDAVTLPPLQPAGGKVAQTALLQENRPRIVGAKVFGNPQEQ